MSSAPVRLTWQRSFKGPAPNCPWVADQTYVAFGTDVCARKTATAADDNP